MTRKENALQEVCVMRAGAPRSGCGYPGRLRAECVLFLLVLMLLLRRGCARLGLAWLVLALPLPLHFLTPTAWPLACYSFTTHTYSHGHTQML